MAITPFLAMTAAEMHNCTHLPPKIAWMACHFSPYGRGLSNLPDFLPEGSMLVVDDITPIHGHDPEVITRQLTEAVHRDQLAGILLDFQRPEIPEEAELVAYLAQSLPCPLAVSAYYAPDCNRPVFLPPLPPSVPLPEYLKPWIGREIWMDLSSTGELLALSEVGCNCTELSSQEWPEKGFVEEMLHCHYQINAKDNTMEFTLWRTHADFLSLLEEAESLGVSHAAGLYQELHSYNI